MKLSGKKGTEQSKKKSVGKAKKASEVIKVPGDWLYMTPQEIGVRQIYEAFGEQDGYELEIWEDAGVLVRWSFCRYRDSTDPSKRRAYGFFCSRTSGENGFPCDL